MGKYFITTAIDYVNSVPHIGTSYEKILADAAARWKRLKGDEVFFLMGNDEHSQNVADRAAELKLDPKTYCDQMEAKFKDTWAKLDISFDRFIRTTEPDHHKAAQEIFRRIRDKGDIKKALYKGLYCVGCEARKTESELQNGRCPNHPSAPLKQMEEENYFFLLSKYSDPIRKLLEGGAFVDPHFRAKEMLSILNEGLEDISISRRSTTWGVPIPDDPEQVMYVWFDALVNYLTATGFPDGGGALWPADCHVVGKDITRFHSVIWPAMLLSAGLELPKKLAVHGFVYIGGHKASKTDKGEAQDPRLSVLKDPIKLADRFGADAVRYFLLREVGFGQDGEISWEKIHTRYTSELANDLGNLVNRVVSMTDRYLMGTFDTKGAALPQDAALGEKTAGLVDRVEPLMDRMEYHTALGEIWDTVRAVNGYIEATAPWTLNKQGKKDEIAGVLYRSAEALRILAIMISPVLPSSAGKILAQLGIPDTPRRLENARQAEYVKMGTRVRKEAVLFQKIDAEQF